MPIGFVHAFSFPSSKNERKRMNKESFCVLNGERYHFLVPVLLPLLPLPPLFSFRSSFPSARSKRQDFREKNTRKRNKHFGGAIDNISQSNRCSRASSRNQMSNSSAENQTINQARPQTHFSVWFHFGARRLFLLF